MTEHAAAGALILLAFALSAALLRRNRPQAPRSEFPPALLPPVLDLLGRTPFDRRSPLEQRRIVQHLHRVAATTTEAPVHAKISLLLGEMALVTGDREQAVTHFRSALASNPGLALQRTLDRLETPAFPLAGSRRER